jgi:Type II secretion system (T2SS), protein E, N-terminal domain
MIAQHIFLTPSRPAMATSKLSFPTLSFDPENDWEWPKPPYACDDPRPPVVGAVEPCRVEFADGRVVEGELVSMKVGAKEFTFRRSATDPGVQVAFRAIHRLSLHAVWELRRSSADAPIETSAPELNPRDYMADCGGVHLLTGRTMGMVKKDEGWFLYTPVEQGRTVMRVFVPADNCRELELSKSIQEKAAERWVSTPEALLAAVEAQRTAKVLPMGEALVDLGLIASEDVERVLAQYERHSDKPLGERLVDGGWIRRDDLQTALAYKMGYPIVDVLRFPIDIEAVRRIPHRVLLEQHAMPLMQRGDRLYVAVDNLRAIPALQQLRSLSSSQVVAALAPHAALKTALATLAQRLGKDPWANNVTGYL